MSNQENNKLSQSELKKFLEFFNLYKFQLLDMLTSTADHPCPPNKDRTSCNCWCRGCWQNYLKGNIKETV